MKNLVVYHASCADGFTAAWAASKSLGLGQDTEYMAYHYGDPEPDGEKYNNVYILDFSFSAPTLVALAKNVKGTVVLLDHHKSAQADLSVLMDGSGPANLIIKFDMAKSGAALAWNAFQPATPVPALVQYVQDRDLWAWKLPDSEEISTYIQTLDFDFETWDRIARQLEEDRESVVVQGRAMQAYRDAIVKRISSNPGWVELDGYRVPCVNSAEWQSEIGSALAKDHPFAVVWFMNQKGVFVYSLRSDKESPDAVDVSIVAKKFGGGGHKNAAGFAATAQ